MTIEQYMESWATLMQWILGGIVVVGVAVLIMYLRHKV